MTLEPMTTRQLITQLERLVCDFPAYENVPVHMLDMDEKVAEERWACLVTQVELDCFSEEQGPVVSLLAEREPTAQHNKGNRT